VPNRVCMCLSIPLQQLDMLRGIIIQSGNDASEAVAEHLAGSEEAFAELMNGEAKRLGMKDTQFKNATGLTQDGHYTSAYDMATSPMPLLKIAANTILCTPKKNLPITTLNKVIVMPYYLPTLQLMA
jgi:hypothetical protein